MPLPPLRCQCCALLAIGTYGHDNIPLCQDCKTAYDICDNCALEKSECGHKECDDCGFWHSDDSEDEMEDCETCGYIHHCEDKCPVGNQTKMYEKWVKEEPEEKEAED